MEVEAVEVSALELDVSDSAVEAFELRGEVGGEVAGTEPSAGVSPLFLKAFCLRRVPLSAGIGLPEVGRLTDAGGPAEGGVPLALSAFSPAAGTGAEEGGVSGSMT